jgi:hypothetical protein
MEKTGSNRNPRIQYGLQLKKMEKTGSNRNPRIQYGLQLKKKWKRQVLIVIQEFNMDSNWKKMEKTGSNRNPRIQYGLQLKKKWKRQVLIVIQEFNMDSNWKEILFNYKWISSVLTFKMENMVLRIDGIVINEPLFARILVFSSQSHLYS